MKTPAPNPALRNPTRSELPALLVELEESGLGVAAFARSRNLKPQNLYVARRKLKLKSAGPIFDPVRLVGPDQKGEVFELRLKTGHHLGVPANFDAAALRRLLEVLEAC